MRKAGHEALSIIVDEYKVGSGGSANCRPQGEGTLDLWACGAMHTSQALHVSLCVCLSALFTATDSGSAHPLGGQSIVAQEFGLLTPCFGPEIRLNVRWSMCSRDVHPVVAQELRTCPQGSTSSNWVLPPGCYCSPKYQEVRATKLSHFLSEVM